MFKPRPWWLFFIGGSRWVTIYPNIYLPFGAYPDLCHELAVHELVHLRQQEAMGRWKWFLLYAFSRSFRLDQEAKAIAAEIKAFKNLQWQLRTKLWYVDDLAGWPYLFAARSRTQALAAIERELSR